jgi:uncharacterized protein (TIGR01244 family)
MTARASISIAVASVTIFACGCREDPAGSSQPPSSPAQAPESSGPAAPPPKVAAPAADRLAPTSCGAIARLHAFGDIWLASQPSPDDFEHAKKAGIRTVINQRPESEIKDFDERAVVTSLGLRYENPGWNGPKQFTDEIIEETLDLLRSVERPVMMHCASANRSGAIWIVYRVLDGGLDVDAAVAEAKTVGLRTPEYERIARDYVERHR